MEQFHRAIVFDDFIFLVVPKVANTSIKVALANWSGKHFDVGPNGPLVHHGGLFNYVPIKDLRKYKQPKYGFVRDPWSRLVSCYRNKIEGKGAMQLANWNMRRGMPFEEFLTAIQRKWGNFNHHWAPCNLWAVFADVDKVIKFENLGEEWKKLQGTYGLPDLPIHNKTGADQAWRHYFTPTTFELVRDLYKEDVNKWYPDWTL